MGNMGIIPDFRARSDGGWVSPGGSGISRRGFLRAAAIVTLGSAGLCRAVSRPYGAIVTGRVEEIRDREMVVRLTRVGALGSRGLWATDGGVDSIRLDAGDTITIDLSASDCTRSGVPRSNRDKLRRLPEEGLQRGTPITMSIEFDLPMNGCAEGPPRDIYVVWARRAR